MYSTCEIEIKDFMEWQKLNQLAVNMCVCVYLYIYFVFLLSGHLRNRECMS